MILLTLPSFSSGIKGNMPNEKKDEILSSIPSPSLRLDISDEDAAEKRKILSIKERVEPTLSLRHSKENGEAYVEYGEDFLNYFAIVGEDTVELMARKEGSMLLKNGEVIDQNTLKENITLFQEALDMINEILSSPTLDTTENLIYSSDSWESTLSWTIGHRYVYSDSIIMERDQSIWQIKGYIEKDKIPKDYHPLSLFNSPYFIIESVNKDGEERNLSLW